MYWDSRASGHFILKGRTRPDRLLRYFTPTEVAALLGFPSQFSFPASVSTKQQYKLRISVLVVALLIVALFTYLAPPQVSDPT